jgi:hypothetical protein
MRLFAQLWTAVSSVVEATSNLAASLNGLARTFDQVNAHVRENLNLSDPLPVPALVEPAKTSKVRKEVA